MSRRERETRVPLDGLNGDQLTILREEATDWLVTKADDLRPCGTDDEWSREVGEVAALGRLVSGLRRGEAIPSDRTVRDLVARETSETMLLDELKEEYGRVLAEHEAWLVLLAHFGDPGVEDASFGGRDEGDAEDESDEEEEEALRSPGPGWLPGDDADCRREVLALLLAEAPDSLVFDDVVVALAGDFENRQERNDLRDAIQMLVAAGLVSRQDGVLAPTRSARQMTRLGFHIG